MKPESVQTCLVASATTARYGFGSGHPFGTDRQAVFLRALNAQGLQTKIVQLESRAASRAELESFHEPEFVERVMQRSRSAGGYLDGGDTPAFIGIFEVASHVVGAGLVALEAIMGGRARRGFVPIGGLHHAARAGAAGFCVFNDCGVVIEQLRRRFSVRRVAYVDIDAHHGDGVFYGFEDDPDVLFADIHEDGRSLYPGTGRADEIGRGPARGTKINIPLPAGADDVAFMAAWERVEVYLVANEPEFILLQAGTDSINGDPLTHLAYSAAAHGHAAARLAQLADRYCQGRLLAFGGGGYNHQNLAAGWTRVLSALL